MIRKNDYLRRYRRENAIETGIILITALSVVIGFIYLLSYAIYTYFKN